MQMAACTFKSECFSKERKQNIDKLLILNATEHNV